MNSLVTASFGVHPGSTYTIHVFDAPITNTASVWVDDVVGVQGEAASLREFARALAEAADKLDAATSRSAS